VAPRMLRCAVKKTLLLSESPSDKCAKLHTLWNKQQ